MDYDVPNRHKHLNNWFPVGGAVWAGYGFFRRCGIAGWRKHITGGGL